MFPGWTAQLQNRCKSAFTLRNPHMGNNRGGKICAKPILDSLVRLLQWPVWETRHWLKVVYLNQPPNEAGASHHETSWFLPQLRRTTDDVFPLKTLQDCHQQQTNSRTKALESSNISFFFLLLLLVLAKALRKLMDNREVWSIREGKMEMDRA